MKSTFRQQKLYLLGLCGDFVFVGKNFAQNIFAYKKALLKMHIQGHQTLPLIKSSKQPRKGS